MEPKKSETSQDLAGKSEIGTLAGKSLLAGKSENIGTLARKSEIDSKSEALARLARKSEIASKSGALARSRIDLEGGMVFYE